MNSSLSPLGFVGLGAMGQPMALNLVKAGYPLAAYNRTASRADPLVQAGATLGNSPAEAAQHAEIVITMVSDSAAVEEVILGANGVIQTLKPGGVVIDMSSISPAVTRKIAEALTTKGLSMLDAPVSGGVGGAVSGGLSIMVGGDAAVFDRCLPILQVMGKRITQMGPSGAGQTTKLCNQIVGMGTLAAVADGLRFAQAAGMDLDKIFEVLGAGAAGSWQLANTGKLIAAQDWRPGFRASLALKDLRLALDAAEEMGLTLNDAQTTAGLFTALVDAGGGDLGCQAVGQSVADGQVQE